MASTLRDPAPAPNRLAAAAAPLSERLGRVPRRERVLLAVVLLILTVVPAAIAAARSSEVRVELALERAAPGFSAPQGVPAYVRSMLRGSRLREHVAGVTGRSWRDLEDHYDAIEVVRRGAPGHREVVMRVPADTVRDAEKLADAIVGKLDIDAELQVNGRTLLARIGRRLRDENLSEAVRRRLITQRLFARAGLRSFRNDIPLRASRPVTEAPRGTVDRAIDSLPGENPPYRSPVWTGLAGLLLGLALCSLWLLARSPAPREPA
jgi:hypothetical protein